MAARTTTKSKRTRKAGTRRRGPEWWRLLSIAFAHPLRIEVLKVLAEEKTVSPSGLIGTMGPGTKLPNVAYHVRQLHAAGLIHPVRTEPRRGAVEHFYELTADGEGVINAIETIEAAR